VLFLKGGKHSERTGGGAVTKGAPEIAWLLGAPEIAGMMTGADVTVVTAATGWAS